MNENAAPLTPKSIAAAKPGTELRDGGAPGLRVRVGLKSRVFRWHVTSAHRVITLGPWWKESRPGHLTLAEARVWLEKLKVAHKDGRLAEAEAELARLRPQLTKPAAPAGPASVKSVAADFMVYIERERKRPEHARRPIDCDIVPAIGEMHVAAVTSQDCRRVVDGVVARGSTRQAGVVLATMKQLFSFAVDRGDIDANPAERFRNPRALGITNNVCQRYLSSSEISAFWRALDAYRGITPTVRAGLKLLLLTGVRSGELLRARIADVDLKARTWVVPPEHQKLTRVRERTARPFVVPLAPTALALFEQLSALAKSLDSEHLMASFHARAPGEPITDKSLNHAMRRLFEGPTPLLKFDGERPTPHDLRRTVRTHLGEAIGVQWHVAERCLNHALPKIAATYDVADYLEERRAALEKWGEFVARLVDPALKNVVMLKRAAGVRAHP